jgi:hypothetical protein
MPTFTIDSDNNITARTVPPGSADPWPSFSNAEELGELTAEWPASRLIETWNSFAGVAPFDELKPVKKFTSRKAAVARIWQAVTRLSLGGAPQAAPVAPAKGKARKSSVQANRRAPTKKIATEERRNKKAEVIAMMKRPKGATLAEIVEATGWQKHTVRGLISILGNKGGLKIESSKNAKGDRHYHVAK